MNDYVSIETCIKNKIPGPTPIKRLIRSLEQRGQRKPPTSRAMTGSWCHDPSYTNELLCIKVSFNLARTHIFDRDGHSHGSMGAIFDSDRSCVHNCSAWSRVLNTGITIATTWRVFFPDYIPRRFICLAILILTLFHLLFSSCWNYDVAIESIVVWYVPFDGCTYFLCVSTYITYTSTHSSRT